MTPIIDTVQDGLSIVQAVPIFGAIIASPVKMGVSLAQMIGGLAIGILFGMGATIADAVGAKELRNKLGVVALNGFVHAGKGFGSLVYASANLATLGIVGLVGETFRVAIGVAIEIPELGNTWLVDR